MGQYSTVQIARIKAKIWGPPIPEPFETARMVDLLNAPSIQK